MVGAEDDFCIGDLYVDVEAYVNVDRRVVVLVCVHIDGLEVLEAIFDYNLMHSVVCLGG